MFLLMSNSEKNLSYKLFNGVQNFNVNGVGVMVLELFNGVQN